MVLVVTRGKDEWTQRQQLKTEKQRETNGARTSWHISQWSKNRKLWRNIGRNLIWGEGGRASESSESVPLLRLHLRQPSWQIFSLNCGRQSVSYCYPSCVHKQERGICQGERRSHFFVPQNKPTVKNSWCIIWGVTYHVPQSGENSCQQTCNNVTLRNKICDG